MKVAVIGAGSSYTPELVNGFLERVASLSIADLCLMDYSPERLEVVGGFARRMVEAKANPFRVSLTTQQRQAVEGASYVITQLRVGGNQARREDEYLGRRHGLVGQETTGVGGMACALRTIPIVMSVARDMAELAPGALLVNFTNPAGLVTEALARYIPGVPSVGVCNVAIGTKLSMLASLAAVSPAGARAGGPADPLPGLAPGRAELDTLGLNHLTWHRGFTVDGRDVWPMVFEGYLAQLRADPDPEWDPRTIASLGMIPNYYLQYYYYTDRKLALQQRWPPSRAEEVMEIEQALLEKYAEIDRVEPPGDLTKRGGAYYSTVAAQLLSAHYNDLGETHVVNVPHGGAVSGWPEDWVLEMPCRVDAAGIRPLPATPLPPVCYGLLAQVKMYELLTVEAAVHGDRDAAYQALLAHPLGPAADRVQAVLADLLETHRPYLSQFW